jgi:hypothetical protein
LGPSYRALWVCRLHFQTLYYGYYSSLPMAYYRVDCEEF